MNFKYSYVDLKEGKMKERLKERAKRSRKV